MRLIIGNRHPVAGRQDLRKLVPYVISDPDLIEHPERVREEFRKNLNLDNFGVKPATADGPSELTRARPRAAAAGPESYGGALADDLLGDHHSCNHWLP
ncbi:hypothetical protein [Micromonospora chokoriensis]|uniref:hypothetical protein n=1 Tax=Micromonospora chokoriensis TaxID=356851 RepID=UPI0012FE4A7E|nr:hypothetical protein [Micromonospora chokoriensis]